jgi:serine/threonine protein kinase
VVPSIFNNDGDFNVSWQFKDIDWNQAEMVLDAHGQKIMMSGRFGTVFKVKVCGNYWAMKEFTTIHREERQKRYYKEISKYVNAVGADSPFVEFDYLQEGKRNVMNGKRYPLVPMEWVQGVTMFEWLTKQCQANNRKQLQAALLKWVDVMAYLKERDIAHGDLQHGNVMFTDNDEIKLVDYDGMCVPALQGLDALEAGVVPYQHPSRGADTKLSSTLDHHSSIFIYVAISALAEAPNLWQEFVLDQDYEKLLFQKEDLESPGTSALFSALKTQAPVAHQMSLELAELYNGDIAKVPALERFLHQ